MDSYLILCRSLTHAQRTAGVLEQNGIKGHISRLPRTIAGEGCGYCVKIADRNLDVTVNVLRREGLGPKRVFAENGNGSFVEVVL